jgi:hypothetical protein
MAFEWLGVFVLSIRRHICNVEERFKHTVDSNGNTLVEGVAIGTDEGWDTPKAIYLQVIGWDAFGRLCLDDLKINIVCLRDSPDGS